MKASFLWARKERWRSAGLNKNWKRKLVKKRQSELDWKKRSLKQKNDNADKKKSSKVWPLHSKRINRNNKIRAISLTL